MNRIFRLIWNPRLAMYVPAPECGRGRGKASALLCAAGAAVLSTLALPAHALPTGSQVSAGQGSIGQSATAMTVTQQSPKLAINWQSFGIGAAESVNFVQPSASAIALNRVLGADASQIYGRLSANGQVWLLNPNGVLFGGRAQVNVGGLVASTLKLSDADFLAGKRSFSGAGGSVVNQGAISAADGGYVALLGGKVSNEGLIQARLGTVALGAGNQVTLDFAGDKLLNLQVDQGAVDALAQNKQLIRAEGGAVLLSARAANALLGTVVNNTGVIEARTIDTRSGTIKLLGGMEGGTVQVAGTLDASAPNSGDGGFIETSGAHVSTAANARITTAAAQGRTGQWLIDPVNFTIAPQGGDMSGAALASQLGTSNVTILSSSGSTEGSGDVKVNDSIAWNSANALTLSAYHDVRVVKTINNAGTGNVTLRADNTGACVAGAKNCGTVSFTPQAHISANGGAVNLYYNPAGSNNAADANGKGPSYASPTDYSGYVTLSAGSTLNAWMLVNDVNQLQAMNTNLAGYYALGRNVDAAATVGWNAGAGFVPLGSSFSQPFAGSFDGQGHTITGLTIHGGASSTVGYALFAHNDGQVKNVGVLGTNVTGSDGVAALVARNHGSVSNSYSSGSFNAFSYAGGLVAFNDGGTVSDSSSSGTVSGFSQIGGLVGGSSGSISNSHSSASVTGSIDVGGLVGLNMAAGTISSSSSTGAVSQPGSGFTIQNVGGLVGANQGTVSDSSSSGNVSGYQIVGGLAGLNRGIVRHSSSSGAVNGSYLLVGGLIGSNDNRGGFGIVSDSHSTGAVNGHEYVGGLAGWSNGVISNSFSSGSVNGTLWDTGGLVGFNQGSVTESFSSGNVTGAKGVGGLIGSNEGTVSNSYSTGSVNGGMAAGGLVGYNWGTVSTSYSTGAISGSQSVGGLVGSSPAGMVTNSYWNTATSGQSTSAGGTGLTNVQMKQKASFIGFDFINIWDINEGVSYPFLRAD